ncbi:type III PLP-dependent enzyme [Methylocystis sp. FS]|uniref:type III PLP-dependent enzyme n=1 Tax=Methylocystis silviterrae TaxID=2743612 RepID=UPI0015827CCE|nr:type III PLP-dependent enzyme [Methylocystis silviterrae]NUJ81393.1 type III PLP-dependent enzyme [Methylocystis silviterrae]
MTAFIPSLELVERLVNPDQPVSAFIHDLDRLDRHARRLVSVLPPGVDFFYAVKANSDAAILKTLAPIVAGFEVASGGEIRKVREAVGDGARVIMGGPARTASDFDAVIDHGVERVHIESIHLLHLANAVAKVRNTQLPVLLRVNLAGPVPGATITMGGQPTQFGIDESEVDEALGVLATCPNLRFDGFHLHTISNNLDATAHSVFCLEALRRARAIADRHGLDLEIVNLGGGWGVDYANIDRLFDVDRLAAALSNALGPGGPRIQFECGRIVVAYCAVYVCEVIDVKTNHEEAFALLRGGAHHFRLPSAWRHRHPFRVVSKESWPWAWSRRGHTNRRVTVTGELCTPKDVLLNSEPFSSLRIGDLICFLLAGAYGWDISHHDFLSNAHPERIFLPVGEHRSRLSTKENERISV